MEFLSLYLSQQTSHKTAEVLYKQILWHFQPQNSFSEHPKNQVFFPYKDKLAPSFRSKVVYRANCWDCNDSILGKRNGDYVTGKQNILKRQIQIVTNL